MPEYLAPGVFVEETSFRSKSIEGVGTSVAGVVGPTRFGPLRGRPELVTSYSDFLRIYGDAEDLDFGGTKVLNHVAIAARAFFDNGGKQLFVSRVVKNVNLTNAAGDGSSATRAFKALGAGRISSRFAGKQGEFSVELRFRPGSSVLRFEPVDPQQPNVVVLVDATVEQKADLVTTPAGDNGIPPAAFPIRVRALATTQADGSLRIDAAKFVAWDKNAQVIAGGAAGLTVAAGKAKDRRLLRQVLVDPQKDLPSGNRTALPVLLRLASPIDLTPFGGAALGGLTELQGVLSADRANVTFASAANPGLPANAQVPLAALHAIAGVGGNVLEARALDLDVHVGGPDGPVLETLADIEVGHDKKDITLVAGEPTTRARRLSQSIVVAVNAGTAPDVVLSDLMAACDAALRNPTKPGQETRYVIRLAAGSDGLAPDAPDYAGQVDANLENTGLAALEDVEDISIVMTPAAAAHPDAGIHQQIVGEVQKHCRKMRYRVGLVDGREGWTPMEVREFRSQFDDTRLALYYPWVVTSDPTGARKEIVAPPSGFMAGVYAGTDVSRGVHKAPANEIVVGALRFDLHINRFQQELLNPIGVNCLRSFPWRGHRVWGARTMSSDPEWKYVNVRRYFLYLERSIERATQWVVFEPNGEALWSNVSETVEQFLFNEWKERHLLGGTPKAAYFVRCDRTTMSQNDLDNGRLVCLIGVAPLTPAEFVIFRIGQKTADA